MRKHAGPAKPRIQVESALLANEKILMDMVLQNHELVAQQMREENRKKCFSILLILLNVLATIREFKVKAILTIILVGGALAACNKSESDRISELENRVSILEKVLS